MNDAEFLRAFETVTLDSFPHRSHIRMAWLYLKRDGWEKGVEAIRGGIQHFALKVGATNKYHETITCFWARMVYAAMRPDENDFGNFLEANPHLLNGRLIGEYYSVERLASPEARREWVEPDVKALPER